MAWTEFTNYSLVNPSTKGTLVDKRLGLPIPISIPIYGVVPTSPGAAPAPKVAKVPAGFKPMFVSLNTDGLSASAGVALTASLGDSDDADRLVAAQDFDAAALYNGLKLSGANYEYAVDTDILLTINTGKTPVAGQSVWGVIVGVVRQ